MKLYIIRHADPDYAHHTITPAGHEEARVLAERLAAEGITRLYSSPLGRARDTARYAAERLGLTPQVEDWLRELDVPRIPDPHDGRPLPAFSVAGQIVRGKLPLPCHEDWHARPPFDRPEYRAALDAVRAGSDALLAGYGYERDGGVYRVRGACRERVAVVCHGGLARTWLSHLLALPLPLLWCGFWLPSSSVSVLVFEQRTPGIAVPVCLALGDTSHLYKAGLPVSRRGLSLDGE